MSSPIQAGLLAYGMSGQIFQAPFLAAHPGFTLRAVTERHQQRAANDYPGIISYPSVEALLADEEIELVVVNTPSNTHVELATQALRAGKHVLIEKPVAATVAELQGLYDLGRTQNRQVLAYQNRRWDSDFQAVRAVVESGQLGQLIEVHFRYDRYRPVLNPKPFKETPGPGSGLLYDLGPHLIDQVISLFGRPLAVHKVQGAYRPETRVDDFFTLHLRYPGALNVFVSSSLLVAQPLPAFVLHGTRGSFVKARADVQEGQLQQGLAPTAAEYGHEDPAHAGSLTLADAGGQLHTQPVPGRRGDYQGLFEAVYQAIRHQQPYPIREEELRWQLELLEQPADHFRE
ncbi:Gfo/Idh/MocA family oxidoreductase [Hymenobacter sp. BT175]|uniref:Gfo/Idh/MocA family protein n=1 Tax=Hymenobacter translucens TaxID=2886507 RepID=UPI001D0E6260|nr:Gfo/Idh/MocA family oxidoreductase [Hymenobacter translucens]MCC2545620.1 Gfo/Idh/MocA family oxidoreductase [Hymenobacter translucens]